MKKSAKKSRRHLWAQLLVGILGLILSIAFHELFHVFMHLDQAPHIGLFPQHSDAIVEVDVQLPQDYDLEGEEILAYIITIVVWIVTIMIIFKIRDGADNRKASQILFPNDKKMQRMNPTQLLDLAERVDPSQVMVIPSPVKKPLPKKRRARARKTRRA